VVILLYSNELRLVQQVQEVKCITCNCLATTQTRTKNSRNAGLQFQDFPGPMPFSKTFQGLEFWTIKFQDFPGSVRTLRYSALLLLVQHSSVWSNADRLDYGWFHITSALRTMSRYDWRPQMVTINERKHSLLQYRQYIHIYLTVAAYLAHRCQKTGTIMSSSVETLTTVTCRLGICI